MVGCAHPIAHCAHPRKGGLGTRTGLQDQERSRNVSWNQLFDKLRSYRGLGRATENRSRIRKGRETPTMSFCHSERSEESRFENHTTSFLLHLVRDRLRLLRMTVAAEFFSNLLV